MLNVIQYFQSNFNTFCRKQTHTAAEHYTASGNCFCGYRMTKKNAVKIKYVVHSANNQYFSAARGWVGSHKSKHSQNG